MSKKSTFRRKLLASAIASCSLSAFGGMAYAQTPAQQPPTVTEEVVVTGIRASLERAMDIKRESSGVVDAISAEDIGKFPDTNLAESLQRITGVSISRSNGEGSTITVRGFGPDNNMITLNGRTLPGGSAYGGGSGANAATTGGNSRAFDFSNLASEAVAGLEVYKTGRASIPTGGIGAAVNIRTARPLDNPGFNGTVAAKGLHDTTTRTGREITPEVSGMFSWSDDSDQFGVALSLSHQERDSGYVGATVNDWNIGRWGQDDLYDQGGNFDSDVFVNPPEEGQLYSRPNDIRYAYSESQRVRTNGMFTLQFAPNDFVTATADYVFARNDLEEHRGEVTNWVQNGSHIERVVFDNSAVAIPLEIAERYWDDDAQTIIATRDQGYEQQFRAQINYLQSLGLNLDFNVTDNFSVALDLHNSTMKSRPNGPGYVGELAVGLGAPTKHAKTLFFGPDLPYWTHELISENGELNKEDISSSVLRNFSAEQDTNVRQFRIDASWMFDNAFAIFEGGQLDFGIESSETRAHTVSYNGQNNQELGGWGASNPGEFNPNLFELFDLPGEFSDFSTGAAPPVGLRADARVMADYLVRIGSNPAHPYYATEPYVGVNYIKRDGSVGNSIGGNDFIREETNAVYLQASLDGTLRDMAVNTVFGLRYEQTDVTSSAAIAPLSYMDWTSDNDFFTIMDTELAPFELTSNYNLLLPSLDLSVNFTDDLVGRFSASKTVARPNLGSLSPAVGNYSMNGASILGYSPTAQRGDPTLKPLESVNLDVSVEWYFDNSSYASIALFNKDVSNFIGSRQVTETLFGIQDQTAGPRAQAALAALQELGYTPDNGRLYTMMMIMDNPDQDLGPFDDSDAQQQALGENCRAPATPWCNLQPQDDDPLTQWRVNTPVNNDQKANIRGVELAVQHFFGDTGFGVQANYTFVDGDIENNDLSDPSEEQFALLGLSDTANLVLMYENFGFQGRLAYNWRSENLAETNQGAGNSPRYVGAYSQIDLSMSYDITDNFQIYFEGINLTGENNREYARNTAMLWYLEEYGARYALGVRASF